SSCLALCADGTLAAWGQNGSGQLGNGSTAASTLPVAVDRSGVLAGKTVVAIAANGHCLALCSDGTLAAWGFNYYGQLGNNSTTDSKVPVAVVRNGALAGKTVTAIAATSSNSYALCSDGTLAAWGYNSEGQLGNNSTTTSSVPVLVNSSNLAAGERFAKVSGSFALVASPPRSLTPSIADGSSVVGTGQSLAWSSEPLASSYRVFFGTDRDAVAAATDASPEYLGESLTPAWTGAQPALAADTVYFWRVDTHFGMGMRPGKVWSFRIAPIAMPTSVSHAVIKGMAAGTLDFPMISLMAGPQPWTASATPLPPWLALVTASGTTPDPLRLRFTPGTLAAGLYQATVRVTSGAATVDLPVAFRVVAAGFSKIVAHPVRPVVYGINAVDEGEGIARVVEIDAATGAMLRSLPAGRNPTGVDLDPAAERLYIANMADWAHVGVEVIDVAAWMALPPLVLGPDTYHLEATPAGRLITEGGNQWGVNELYDAATGTKLAALGGVRVGGCQADPTGRFFYHSDSNSSGARIRKFDISGDTFVAAGESPIIAYGGANLILSGDGSRLFWQGYSLAADSLGVVANLKNEVVACNRTGDLAVSESAVWWADSGTQAATLPFASTVAAVSANDGYLVRFNPATSALVATPLSALADLPGPWPRPGLNLDGSPQRLSWSPVADALSYRVYLADSAAQLQAMTSPTATVTDHFYDVPEELAAGRNWFWRVDVVKASTTATGLVRSFGIRFASGPEVPRISPSQPTGADALAFSDRALLVGMGYASARVLEFDPETGNTTPGRSFVDLQQGGLHLAMDGDRVWFGAAGYSAAEGIESSGAVFTYRRQPDGTWRDDGRLTLASPADGDLFGTGLAADGNLALAGTGRSGDYMDVQVGRVAAYITEPGPAAIQEFRPADGASLDHFGHSIVLRGNHAVISATGGTDYYGPTGCLYAFNRSTTTGRWEQAQKISIAGATAGSYPGEVLAMSGNLLATTNGNGGVVVYSRGTNGVWSQSAIIQQSSVAGSSTLFGSSLALAGDLLFVGDRDGEYQGYYGGAVFVFRRSGSAWTPAPTIAPATPVGQLPTYRSFGNAMAVRDGWLAVGGGQQREVWLFRVDSFANSTPRFLPGIPAQCVIGRALSAPVRAEDADGNGGLTIEVLQKPSWLALTDHGSGNASLGGVPAGSPGDAVIIQFRTRDADGGEAYYATQ
ncbi:MAG: hypothetical protein MUF04_09360, partial [Akkermansiaceae bacterium]|nr:hypothetical protein [Akkermansiaceae bacterium]